MNKLIILLIFSFGAIPICKCMEQETPYANITDTFIEQQKKNYGNFPEGHRGASPKKSHYEGIPSSLEDDTTLPAMPVHTPIYANIPVTDTENKTNKSASCTTQNKIFAVNKTNYYIELTGTSDSKKGKQFSFSQTLEPHQTKPLPITIDQRYKVSAAISKMNQSKSFKVKSSEPYTITGLDSLHLSISMNDKKQLQLVGDYQYVE